MNERDVAWPPQKPPADFADRVALAIVSERQARRASPWRLRSREKVRRSVLVAAVAACVLVVGSAWAWRGHLGHVSPAPAPVPIVVTPPVAAATPAPVRAVASEAMSAAVPLAAPSASAPRPRAKTTPARAASSAASAASTHRVIVPPCICRDVACECGPEP